MKTLVKKPLQWCGIWNRAVSLKQAIELNSRLPHGATVLVHIGKCGGQSLREGIGSTGKFAEIKTVHVEKPVFRKDLKFVVVARGPVSRAISAFNWRYRTVVAEGRQRDMFSYEYEVLAKYKSLNSIAEALYHEDGSPDLSAHRDMRRIHHIKQDIAFYLDELLAKCDPNQILAVLMQENLDQDILRVFGYINEKRIHRNSAKCENLQLSERGHLNLVRFLQKDYAALVKLYCWGKIERDVFLKVI